MTIKMTIPGTDFYLHVVVEKDVPQLEISVNYLVLEEVLDAKQDLVHEVSEKEINQLRFQERIT